MLVTKSSIVCGYLKNTESHVAIPHCIGVIEIHFENNNSYTRGNANVFKHKYITLTGIHSSNIKFTFIWKKNYISFLVQCLYLACIGITIFSYMSILTKSFEKNYIST